MKKNTLFYFSLVSIFLMSCGDIEPSSTVTEEVHSGLSKQDEKSYLKKGKTIAKETFLTLSSHLKSKMKEGGVHAAVEYCNLAAYPLSDSIAKANNITLKRVSNRLRNTANNADSLELDQISKYEEEIRSGIELSAVVLNDGNQVRFMAPILLKPACLNCHGTPEKHISNADIAFIRELYPNDEAINFKTGDLRGIWSISFNEK
jgi:hypothetical protein